MTLAGRYGAGGGDPADDIFRDPLLDGGPTRERLRLLLLRDTQELEPVVRRARRRCCSPTSTASRSTSSRPPGSTRWSGSPR